MVQSATRPGLQKETFRLNFGQGLDTHTDSKVLSSGKMLVLQNAKFQTANRLSKRDGFAAVGATQAGTAFIGVMSSFNGQLFGIGDGPNIPRSLYVQERNANAGNGDFVATQSTYNDCQIVNSPVVANNQLVLQADMATANGYTLYGWVDAFVTASTVGTGTVRMVDATTGQILAPDFNPNNSGSVFTRMIRCVAVGTQLFAVTIETTAAATLGVAIYSLTVANNAVTVLASTSITLTRYTSGPGQTPALQQLDAAAYTTSLSSVLLVAFPGGNAGSYVAAVNPATLAIYWYSNFSASTTTSGLALVRAPPGALSTTFGALLVDSNKRVNLASINTGGGASAATVSAASSAFSTTLNVIIGQQLTNGTLFVAVGSYTGTTVPQISGNIQTYAVNSSGTFSLETNRGGMNLAIHSQVVYQNDNSLYFWTIYPSEIQGQYILMSRQSVNGANSIVPAARTLVGNAIGPAIGTIPYAAVSVASGGSGIFDAPALTIGQQSFVGGVLTQSPALSKMRADFNYANAYLSTALNNQCVIAGGFNALYDGATVGELGFFMFPEGYTASLTTTVGALSVGLYEYLAIYEWYDNYGNLHQSETGVPISITATSATSSVALKIPTLATTLKRYNLIGNNGANEPSVVLYRTTANANPQIFYRVTSIAGTALASGTQFVNYTDTAADSTITANTILYTQGGIADNFTIDGTSVICAGPDRIYAADPNNTGIIHVGKPYTQTVGLSFFSGITILIPTEGGPVTNMQYMDSSLVIFKARMIIVVQGQGPTANGQGSSYSPALVVTRDVGCDNPRAATSYTDGILFKSAKGYYRLGRDLSFAADSNYIGQGVEAFNSFLCLRAMTREDRNEARFLLSNNQTILVYNYLFNQWSSIITSATDMTEVNGAFYVSSATPGVGALVAQETVGAFTDALLSPTGIPFLITTGWCALNQLQGCQRVYRVRFLGDFKSTHTLKVEFAYDFEGGDSPTFSETHNITSANITSNGSAYQCEAFPLRQKCEAIAIRISDPSPTGESFDMTDIELEVGVTPGRRFPLSATKGF